jgi:integrase/recombinase XerC
VAMAHSTSSAAGPGQDALPDPARADSDAMRGHDEQLVQQYLSHVRVEKRLAQRTVELYTLDLQKLAEFARAAGLSLLQVHSAHVRRWIAQMHAGGRSGRGIALILSGWRGFYTWLGRQGLIASNPVQDVRAPKAAKPLPKALSVDEAVQLASYRGAGHGAAAHRGEDDDPWFIARDAAMAELLYSSGLRVGELTGLDVAASDAARQAGRGWLDMQAGEVEVQGKGGKRRAVPVGAAARLALQQWLALRAQGLPAAALDAQPALFIGRNGTRLTPQAVWQRLKRLSLQAGLATPVHPHMLRHSFASHVLQSSGDLRAVQELLGHAHIGTTQVYTRLDFQHLARAYDEAHPRAKLGGAAQGGTSAKPGKK